MGDKNDMLDKAEGLARRALERLGAAFETKAGSQTGATLSYGELSDLTSRIEREIESNLTADAAGIARVAPNRIRVALTYERASKLSKEYLDALTGELRTTIAEFAANRRYAMEAPLILTVESDLFAKSTSVRVESSVVSETDNRSAGKSGGIRVVSLQTADGRRFSVSLSPGAAPATVGRTATNAVALDDPDVSRIHCALSLKSNGEVVVADLGSANGTAVNGQLLGPADARVLNKDDVIGVGDLRLTVIGMD